MWRRNRFLAVLGWIVVLLATFWTAGAVWSDGPLGMWGGNGWLALGWLVAAFAALLVLRGVWRRVTWLILFLGVLIPWLGIKPSNDRDWKPDWAQTPWIEIEGGILTVHNFRNFDYTEDGQTRERWQVRSFDLANLSGIDYFHDAFGGDLLAHPMLSFDFGPDGHLVLSIETRREVGEAYSTVGGFYKLYELQYLWGDERDFVRVRSNIRDEPVYLYRTTLSPEFALYVLLDSVRKTNALKAQPQFYNTLWANCTTSLRANTPEWRAIPFDYRMLANGRLDELIYEQGNLNLPAGLSFEAQRAGAAIHDAASAAHDDPDFSARIRAGRPGFD
jgi:hypothetical protein